MAMVIRLLATVTCSCVPAISENYTQKPGQSIPQNGTPFFNTFGKVQKYSIHDTVGEGNSENFLTFTDILKILAGIFLKNFSSQNYSKKSAVMIFNSNQFGIETITAIFLTMVFDFTLQSANSQQ
jgi:hypothetical protein